MYAEAAAGSLCRNDNRLSLTADVRWPESGFRYSLLTNRFERIGLACRLLVRHLGTAFG